MQSFSRGISNCLTSYLDRVGLDMAYACMYVGTVEMYGHTWTAFYYPHIPGQKRILLIFFLFHALKGYNPILFCFCDVSCSILVLAYGRLHNLRQKMTFPKNNGAKITLCMYVSMLYSPYSTSTGFAAFQHCFCSSPPQHMTGSRHVMSDSLDIPIPLLRISNAGQLLALRAVVSPCMLHQDPR